MHFATPPRDDTLLGLGQDFVTSWSTPTTSPPGTGNPHGVDIDLQRSGLPSTQATLSTSNNAAREGPPHVDPTTVAGPASTSAGTGEDNEVGPPSGKGLSKRSRRGSRKAARAVSTPSGVPMPGVLGVPVKEREPHIRIDRIARMEATTNG